MNKQTLALALGQDAEGADEELDEGTSEATPADSDALADDLELVWDTNSDPTTRAEAFRRAVKAAMQ
jgi:hypothetical protein